LIFQAKVVLFYDNLDGDYSFSVDFSVTDWWYGIAQNGLNSVNFTIALAMLLDFIIFFLMFFDSLLRLFDDIGSDVQVFYCIR
jgi:hypothetical protein